MLRFKELRPVAVLIVLAGLLSGCMRGLSDGETSFLRTVYGPQIELDDVWLIRNPRTDINHLFESGELSEVSEIDGKKVSKQKIADLLLKRPAALVLGNTIYYSRDAYSDDFAPRFPDDYVVDDVALLARELMHVWQHQSRERVGYSLAKIIAEHLKYDDKVYDYNPSEHIDLLQYRFEQQGRIVQDYVYCRALAPSHPATAHLSRLVRQVFHVDKLEVIIQGAKPAKVSQARPCSA